MCDLEGFRSVLNPSALVNTCLNGARYVCSQIDKCPHALKRCNSVLTRVCDAHVEFCMHCGKPFCLTCAKAHQESCPMKPTRPGLMEMVDRALARMGE
jgi:hypothetical protein